MLIKYINVGSRIRARALGYKTIVLICTLLFLNSNLFCQKDNSKNLSDSLENAVFLSRIAQLKYLETLRIQDSLKRDTLTLQLNTVKENDKTTRARLLGELGKLEDKDEDRIKWKQQKIDSMRSTAKGYAVAPFLDDTLFFIYSRLGSLPARERAIAINNRIIKIKDNFLFNADSLAIVKSESTTDIVLGEMIVMSVSENDALWQNTTQDTLAQRYKNLIGKEVVNYIKATSSKTLAREAGLVLLVLALLCVLIFFLTRFFRFSKKKIEDQKDKRIKGIKINNYQVLDSEAELTVFLTINTILKWAFIITTFYFALPILFSIFPWTKNYAVILISYFTDPLKNILREVWHYIPKLFTIIVIVVVFRYILKAMTYLKNAISAGDLKIEGFHIDWANPTYQIFRLLTYAFMLIVIFPYLPGSDSPVFRGVSVFLGVLITFGSSGSLSNVVSGLVLTYMRAFKIGDRVTINDMTGDIVEKSLLVTRIRTIKNEIISFPNSAVMNSHTINYSRIASEQGLIVHSTVSIGYGVPWRDMHKALIEAAGRTEFILKDPAPFVLQTSLDDFYVSYQINGYTAEPNKQATIYSQLHQNIQDCCNEAGIEIMSAHYNAVRDGNHSTIPDEYLPKDYLSPGFIIKGTVGKQP
jgi:small-conductance mechanosensitive channel